MRNYFIDLFIVAISIEIYKFYKKLLKHIKKIMFYYIRKALWKMFGFFLRFIQVLCEDKKINV